MLLMKTLLFFLLFIGHLTAFEPFTAKITRDKVRMRLSPALDAPILREFSRNDLVVVTGETEEYFAVRPPVDQKAYVFRTFVIDGVVEGNKVNVRLAPDLEAPIIGQLNEKEKVEGVPCASNHKWLEITPPATVQFFVYKEYIEKLGDESLFVAVEEPKEEVIVFHESPFLVEEAPQKLSSPFEPNELALFESWRGLTDRTLEAFYKEQQESAKHLTGVIKPFTGEIFNKPGDFLLVNPISQVPIGYLYSTLVPLDSFVGSEVTVQASPRSNNNFALPAYAVLQVE